MNMLNSARICLNVSENTGICVDISKSVSVAFVLHLFIVISCLLERVVTNFNVYTKLKVRI